MEFIFPQKSWYFSGIQFSIEFVENYFSLIDGKYTFHNFCGIHFPIKFVENIFHYNIDVQYIFHKI